MFVDRKYKHDKKSENRDESIKGFPVLNVERCWDNDLRFRSEAKEIFRSLNMIFPNQMLSKFTPNIQY